jgi:hypothetical protein
MNRYKYIDEGREHLHTLDGKPLFGTSTVTNVIGKDLTWWAAELSAVECLEKGEQIPTIREEYLEAKKLGKVGIDALQVKYPAFKKARFAHYVNKNDKARLGTDRHALLEEWVKGVLSGNKVEPHADIQSFVDWARKEVKRFLWSEIHGYSERLWTGGICDVGLELKDGTVAVVDAKSSPIAYFSQFVQCAGYDIELSENGGLDKDGNKILDIPKVGAYIVFPFGAKNPIADIRYNVGDFRESFESAVSLHKQKSQFENK